MNVLKSKGIFQSVKSNVYESDQPEKNNIDIIIEEKATGEIFAGAGTGTSGSIISAAIKEKNYLGKGIVLDTNLTLSDDEIIRSSLIFSSSSGTASSSLLTSSVKITPS